MKHSSLVHARAHLSQLVDQAEYQGERIVLSRHGKPAAVLVPLSVGLPKKTAALSAKAFQALLDQAALYDDPKWSAVDDLLEGRR